MYIKIFYCFLNLAGNQESTPGVQDPEGELTSVMLETVVSLLQGSVRNAGKDGWFAAAAPSTSTVCSD